MKPAIAGFLLLVGMGVAPTFAYDGDRDLRRDVQHDEARVAQDRREFRRDLDRRDYDDYAATSRERLEQRRDYRDVNRARREFNRDRR
jgi:hypothetical protein